ncbi:methyl-accepting chemotaxis protein [Marinomonas balearica]|uniref:Methyl-accepting chemotaxis sensory transducer with Cache sensor n=1 Tax=Marinomonas balearica TaxID=491947 RepID=A0A4R6MK45_9GAMM|nr:methyl-accepting chemotaxis protein [Marinomonas balearica]TDP01876.1 methyl-accepting chemotaxis sensory transducer with Cache sensor [Marinomonas balearica]
MKIKTKLIAAFSVAILLPAVLICVITAHLATKSALKSFEESSEQTVTAVERSFSLFMDDIKYVVDFLVANKTVNDPNAQPLTTYFEKKGKAPQEVSVIKGGRERDLFQLFEAIGTTNPNFVYIYAGDSTDGYMEWPGTYGYSEWHPKSRPWYQLAEKKRDQTLLRESYYWEPDDAIYISAVRSYNKGNSFGGVIAVDVSIKTLTDMASKTKLGEHGTVMVIEDTGKILVDVLEPDNGFKTISELEGEAYQKIAKTSEGVVEVNIKGTDYYANVVISPDLGWKFVGIVPKSEILATTINLINTTVIVSIVLLLVLLSLAYVMAKRIIKPIESVSGHLQVIAEGEGDLTARINTDSKDETGILSNWFNQFIESTCNLILSIKQSTVQMDSVASEMANKAQEVASSTTVQLESIDQIASAGREMVIAANEAAENCENTARFSDQGLETTVSGKKLIEGSSLGVQRLGDKLKESNVVISELEKETGNINQILSTIQDIAEQTNLLALNAAIEAARAGEQGRGFAVVADEVRGLAKRTQDSTEQIASILGLLSDRTKEASSAMVSSLTESESAIELSTQALDAFDQIEEVVKQMRDMTMQTAASAEEQRLVTEGINENILSISDSANTISNLSGDVAELSQQQDGLSREIHTLVSKFKTE